MGDSLSHRVFVEFFLRVVPEHGFATQLWYQLEAVVVSIVYVAVVTLAIVVAVDKLVGFKLDEVREALIEADISRITITRVTGHGQATQEPELYRGQVMAPNLKLPHDWAMTISWHRPPICSYGLVVALDSCSFGVQLRKSINAYGNNQEAGV